MYTNADQFVNKRDFLSSEIAGTEPDIIIITEVIPKAQVQPLSLAIFELEGYRTYLNFDPTVCNLGMTGIRGLCIFIRQGLQCLPFLTVSRAGIEALCLRVPLSGSDSLLLGALYRSPSSCLKASTSEICNLMQQISESASTHILLSGDFNYPGINWDSLSSNMPQDHPTTLFLDTLSDCFLTQHIQEPTRYRFGSEPSILDLIISNEEGMVNGISYLPGLGSSDHLIIRFKIICYTSPCQNLHKSKPALYKADYQKLRYHASLIPWEQVNTMDLAEAYSFFKNSLEHLVDSFVPKTRPGRKPNLYMNRAALRMRKLKRSLWAQYMKSKSPTDYTQYTKCRNKLRKMTRQLRKEFELKLAEESKSNPKAFWRYVNTRLKTKTGIDALEDEEGVVHCSPQKKAEILSRYFGSVFVDEDLNTLPAAEQHSPEMLTTINVTTAAVMEKLHTLNTAGTPGPDGVYPRVLHELAPYIASPLASIFNKSLASSQLPECWCQATFIPILKKGSRHLAKNYRPISLTSIPCKVMESIIRDKIMHHLCHSVLLSPHQHGFRPSRSCSSQLLEVMNAWTAAADRGEAVDVIYLDFQKAFDSVPHARLLEKVKSYGIGGEVSEWIRSFLVSRSQQVLVEGARSEWAEVGSGVPQGSVLGPLLFLLYINDLPDGIQNSVKMFADDSKLFGPADTHDSRLQLQEDIQHLERWSLMWQLPFNISKCKVLHIGHRNPRCSYKMFNQTLACSDEERDLGVLVDGTLRFHRQASAAAAKGNQMLGIVRRSFSSLTKTSLPLLYKTLVRPHLEYGNCIWGPMSRGDQRLLEKVQKRATRLVPEIRIKPYKERLQELRLPSLAYRRLRGDMILIYQILHGLLDVDQDLLQLSTIKHTRGHRFKLDIERARTLPRRHFLSVRAAGRWNSLPSLVVSAPSLATFKSRLDDHWSEIHYESIFDE